MQVIEVLLQLPEPHSVELIDAIEFGQLARPEVKALLRRLTAEPFKAKQLGFHAELLRRLCGMLLSNEDMPGRPGTLWWEVPLPDLASVSVDWSTLCSPLLPVGSQRYRLDLSKHGAVASRLRD